MATSVIISSRNRPGFLSDCVASILAGDEVPDEIVIIDQSDARNPTFELIASPNASCTVRYVWSESRGTSRGRNAGIALATHEVLAFTDDDVVVSASWFGALTRGLLMGDISTVVTGRVIAGDAETKGGFAPSTVADLDPTEYRGRVGMDVLFSNNMAMHRSLFDRIGLFDERLGPGTRFPAAEDNDLGFRLLEACYRVRYLPEAAVTHRAWRKRGDYVPLRWSYARGQGAYYAKHLQCGNRYVARRMMRELCQGAWRVCTSRNGRRTAAAEAVSLVGLLSGALDWLMTQRSHTSAAAGLR